MSVRYLQSGDEVPRHPTTSFDDDSGEGFWGGVFLRGVGIALAAVLAIGVSQNAAAQTVFENGNGSDDIPRHPTTSFDDDAGEGWWGGVFLRGVGIAINTAANRDASHNAAAQTVWENGNGSDDLPRHPTITFDDDSAQDFWGGVFLRGANLASNTAAGIAASQSAAAQTLWEYDEQTPRLFGQFDEDFWANPVAPVPATLYQELPYLPDPDEIPAGNLFGQFDEDFWLQDLLPVPVAGTLGPLYLPDAEEIPAAQLRAPADELFWQNPSAPVAGALAWPQQWTFDSQEPTLYGQFDEDFWDNPVAPIVGSLYQPLPLGDPEEIPAGSLHGQFDEDFWWNPTAPVAATFYQRLPYLPDGEEIPAAQLHGQFDEDFWWNPTPPVAGSLWQFLPLGDEEQVPDSGLFGEQDEDFWQNPVAPVQGALYQRLPLGDPEELPALRGQPDEDYWQNPVFPVAAYLYQQLPLGDPEEIPAADLDGQPDEDFWWNQVAPIAGSLYQRLPLGDPEEIPAGSLYGQLDEDFWANPTVPAPGSLDWPQQWVFDSQEPSLFGQLDEDFWPQALFPAPVAGQFWQRLPLFSDPAEPPEAQAGTALFDGAECTASAGTITPTLSFVISEQPIVWGPVKPAAKPAVISVSARAKFKGARVKAAAGSITPIVSASAEIIGAEAKAITCWMKAQGIINPSDDDLMWILSAL